MAIVAMEIELPEELVDEVRRIAAAERERTGAGRPGPVDLIERYVARGVRRYRLGEALRRATQEPTS